MSLDELDRVVRERLIGSPPHSFQLLGTIERIRYLEKIGTMGVLGTVLLTVHIGTLGKVNRLGTLDEITRAGTLNRIAGGRVGSLGRLGTIHYVERIGTVQRLGTVKYLGTVRYIQAGSLGRVERLGTVGGVGYAGKVGTVSRIGTAHTGTVPILTKGRDFDPVSLAAGSHIGRGTTWLGPWAHIGSFLTKTYSICLWGRGSPGVRVGSFAIIVGPVGTFVRGTGTYYGPIGLGGGTFTPVSFTEAMKWTRPYVRRSGTYGGGTVSISLGRQA